MTQIRAEFFQRLHPRGLLTPSVAMLGSHRSRSRPAIELRAYAQQKIIDNESSLRPVYINDGRLSIGVIIKSFVDALEL